MEKSAKRFYWTTLFFLLLLCAYPIAMGVRIVVIQLQNGEILPEDYTQYVIPYAAVCTSILLTVFLYPLLSKLKKFSIWVASIFGVGLFIALELYMEGITINSPKAQSTLQWQLLSCIGTTQAMQAFQKLYDNTFKIHYFLISFLLILLIVGVVYRFGIVVTSRDRSKRRLLIVQIAFTILFILFSLLANVTAFFREAVNYLTPLSSILTGSYFIVMGVTFGIYLAGFLEGRNWFVSVFLPALAALSVTSAMYYGEYRMLDGVLYRFGYTKFFQPIPYTVVAPADLLIIVASGAITAILISVIRVFCNKNKKNTDSMEDNVTQLHGKVVWKRF